MTTQEIVDGLRELVEANKARAEAVDACTVPNPKNLQAIFKADERSVVALEWINGAAAAIADEMERLSKENAELRGHVAAVRPLVEAGMICAERYREYEAVANDADEIKNAAWKQFADSREEMFTQSLYLKRKLEVPRG